MLLCCSLFQIKTVKRKKKTLHPILHTKFNYGNYERHPHTTPLPPIVETSTQSTFQSVDFSIVTNVSKGMGPSPGRECVGGEAGMHQPQGVNTHITYKGVKIGQQVS